MCSFYVCTRSMILPLETFSSIPFLPRASQHSELQSLSFPFLSHFLILLSNFLGLYKEIVLYLRGTEGDGVQDKLNPSPCFSEVIDSTSMTFSPRKLVVFSEPFCVKGERMVTPEAEVKRQKGKEGGRKEGVAV